MAGIAGIPAGYLSPISLSGEIVRVKAGKILSDQLLIFPPPDARPDERREGQG